MKRFRYMTLCLTLAASMLTGCGGGGNSSAVQTTKAPETAEEFRAAMVSRSLLSVGNTTRIRAVMEQAKAGGEVTLAYIGGSITEGYNAGDTGCYARKSYEAFASRYGAGENVQYVNAGLS
ncbi:MAG: SGNH/GDSL hydrolase family protein, partial [Ruminococcus sp.]|nr:SGNH/GDSL hydrolase family protein [Ruminococcus sp.]